MRIFYFFFTNNKDQTNIGINHSNLTKLGTSSNMKKESSKTIIGIIEKLVIATKELRTVNALIHKAFDANKTKNHIKNIHIKFCLTDSISGPQANV
ncbi:hypothetical protein HOF65_08700 [bacterium]|jgi:hypothetical protein|nr:hypothetical protein [bacterium]MBT4632603.1 hypothetical protein [bacterium]MBT5491358.1 hypothetical protein [bacterium]MBT6779455.1 hypothetical protein [bacterium]